MYVKPNRDTDMAKAKQTKPFNPAVRATADADAAARAKRPDPGAEDPQAYYTKPLETWRLCELQDALGTARTAEVLGTTPGNVRMLRHRGVAALERMQALQAAVRADETNCRNALVTLYSTGAFRRRAT